VVTSIQDWLEERNARQPFTEQDWKVIEMARANGPWSQYPDGLFALVARYLVRLPEARSLADKRLEALRRFAVRAWYWDFIRAKDVRAFLAAGYSRIHVLEILSHVGMARGFTPSVEDDGPHLSTRARSTHRQCG
jgi:hypothetical protein